MSAPLTVLCLASYHKGFEFLRELRRLGCRVVLVTSKSLEHEEWPRESIDETFYMPDQGKQWDPKDTLLGISGYGAWVRGEFDRAVEQQVLRAVDGGLALAGDHAGVIAHQRVTGADA